MQDKINFFNARADSFEVQIKILKERFNALSIWRIATFILFLVAAIVMLNYNEAGFILLLAVIFVVVFGLLVNRHNKVKRELETTKQLSQINREETSRLHRKFDGLDDEAGFADDEHPYAHDLDVFGRSSLFQFVNRAATSAGKQLLGSWFSEAFSRETIVRRQEAAKELAPLLDWRQKLQAFGRLNKSEKEKEEAFFKWLDGKNMIQNSRFNRIIPYLMIVFSCSLILAVLFTPLTGYSLFLPIIINGYLLMEIVKYSKTTYDMTLSGVQMLEATQQIVHLIENQNFNHGYLNTLRDKLMPQGLVASEKIKALRKIFDMLSQRSNQMYHILNSIFLLDYIFLGKAEKWRSNYRSEIPHWFEAIAELESLSSIAAFSYANEAYAFPKIAEKPFIFHGTNIGHPLMPEDQVVKNDFSLDGKGKACIVTGSNMAGKSTFLRTVGVNAVLAFAGAPVCGDSLELSEFQVFTSMRTKDNLEENISSFYAELLRLKMLLKRLDNQQPVFYLLDEILKGTNSKDRHLGAESLVLQLNNTAAFGLISTHDLELGKLENGNELIHNYNFSSEIIGEEIVFDYKLRHGICQSTNASQLMKKIGIQIKPKAN